jgi:2-hydroxy-3-oxopropionate reductase
MVFYGGIRLEGNMAERVGFVGLGHMGRGMASNLARAFRVTGFDVEDARFKDLPGVERAGSVAAVAHECAVVCLSLPTAAIVEEVTTGPGGLLPNLARGSLVIDLSTNLPSTSRRIASRLAQKGIDFVDAPVSGGEAGARDASLAIMVGAAASAFERGLPYLSRMGATVTRVGDVGAGGVAKLVNNMIVGAAFAAIAEGFALAMENGLDAKALHEAIRGGWAGSRVLDISAEAIVARQYLPGGTVDMLVKDLDYARALASETHTPIPVSAATHEVFVAGQAAGHGAQSQPSIIELWRAARR